MVTFRRSALIAVVVGALCVGFSGRAVAGSRAHTGVRAQVAAESTPSWQPLGGLVTSDPSPVVDPADPSGLLVFVRGGDDGLYSKRYGGGGWAPYTRVGGLMTSLPFAVSDPTGVSGTAGVYVFLRGGDGALYVGSVVDGVWQGFRDLGGYLDSPPTAFVDSTGVWVAVRGGDGALYTRHLAGGVWGPWQDAGGTILSPAFVGNDGTATYAFAIGLENKLVFYKFSSGQWFNFGGGVYSPPIPAPASVGLQLFYQSEFGALVAEGINGGGTSGTTGLGGYLTSTPEPVASANGVTSVYVRGGDGALWRIHYDGISWQPWSTFGGYLISDSVPVLDGSGTEHVFGVGGDNSLYTIADSAASASGVSAAGAPAAPPRGTPAPLVEGIDNLQPR